MTEGADEKDTVTNVEHLPKNKKRSKKALEAV